MAYTRNIPLDLGAANAGILADLRAQLKNPDGTNNGAAVSTGFTEIGDGLYQWEYAAVPDGFIGAVLFYNNNTGINLAIVSLDNVSIDRINGDDVDGVTLAKQQELLLAFIAGQTTLIPDGGGAGIDRLELKNQAAAKIAHIDFNEDGEWVSTVIL